MSESPLMLGIAVEVDGKHVLIRVSGGMVTAREVRPIESDTGLVFGAHGQTVRSLPCAAWAPFLGAFHEVESPLEPKACLVPSLMCAEQREIHEAKNDHRRREE
jgi:hypothetical protein